MEALWNSLKLNEKVLYSWNPFLNQTSSNHEITNGNPKLHDLPSHLVKKTSFWLYEQENQSQGESIFESHVKLKPIQPSAH
jgi:hypothetical protein